MVQPTFCPLCRFLVYLLSPSKDLLAAPEIILPSATIVPSLLTTILCMVLCKY